MNRLAECAAEILDAAESAAARGQTCSHMTIVVGETGAITLLADSDWPLDSLSRERGAQAVYRLQEHRGALRVEARQGQRRCVIESQTAAAAARFLLPHGWPAR